MKNVFDWTKEITTKKRDASFFNDADWKVFDSFMVHRILSMNPSVIEIVSLAQNFDGDDKKKIYEFYKEYIPKNARWFKYIKPGKNKYTTELLEYIAEFYECSKREAKDAIEVLGDDSVKALFLSRGFNKKEIKKIMK